MSKTFPRTRYLPNDPMLNVPTMSVTLASTSSLHAARRRPSVPTGRRLSHVPALQRVSPLGQRVPLVVLQTNGAGPQLLLVVGRRR